MNKFDLGQVVMTANLVAEIDKTISMADVYRLVARHHSGDWGDVEEEDRLANEEALEVGSRIFSSYKIEDGIKIWIITEADRSYTTIMFPEDY